MLSPEELASNMHWKGDEERLEERWSRCQRLSRCLSPSRRRTNVGQDGMGCPHAQMDRHLGPNATSHMP